MPSSQLLDTSLGMARRFAEAGNVPMCNDYLNRASNLGDIPVGTIDELRSIAWARCHHPENIRYFDPHQGELF